MIISYIVFKNKYENTVLITVFYFSLQWGSIAQKKEVINLLLKKSVDLNGYLQSIGQNKLAYLFVFLPYRH